MTSQSQPGGTDPIAPESIAPQPRQPGDPGRLLAQRRRRLPLGGPRRMVPGSRFAIDLNLDTFPMIGTLMIRFFLASVVSFGLCLFTPVMAENWPQFRGPSGSGATKGGGHTDRVVGGQESRLEGETARHRFVAAGGGR